MPTAPRAASVRVSFASAEDRAKVLKALETLRAGDDLHVTLVRDDKVVELATKFTGV